MGRMGRGICRGGAALVGCLLAIGGAAPATSAQSRTGLPLAARGPNPRDAGSAPAGAYEIEPAASHIQVDGRLEESAWEGAVLVPISFEVNPGDNLDAPVATECRLTYDRTSLYLGCAAHDPHPDDIRAFVTDRDAIEGHDRIVLTLDPFLDQRRAFQFGVSALGVQSDAVLAQQGAGDGQGPDGAPVDPSWDAIWSSAGAITDDGYVVEASIPFQALRFPRSDAPQTWGMVLTRWWPRSVAVEMRSARLDRDDSCILCQADRLAGLADIAPGSTVQLSPTLTASRLDTLSAGGVGRLEAGATDPSMGLDARWGITSDLTLDVTVNPDFSQVEADVAQLDVNNRFALFYPEKRPFFLEGADFFGTPVRAVFTRSVVAPTVGTKLTGKVGANAVGVLLAQDRANNLLLSGPQSSEAIGLDDRTTTMVARIRRDVGASSSVGALLTSRAAEGYGNTVGGFDLFARPLASVTVEAQALRSSTRYPDQVVEEHAQPDGRFGGTALALSARWATRDWSVDLRGTRIDDGFRADAGFLPQTGLSFRNARLVRTFNGDADRWFTRIRMIAGLWRQDDLAGHVLHGGHWFGLTWEGPAQSSLGIWPNFQREYVDGRSYEGMLFWYAEASMRPSAHVALAVDGGFGDAVDYLNGGLGRTLQVTPRIEAHLGRRFETVLTHTRQQLDRDGGRVFTANLTRLRAVYSFSPRSFLRAVLQRRTITRPGDRNAADVDPETRWVFSQLTYGYKVNPQTVLFLGYGEDRRGGVDAAGAIDPLTPDARSFFLKLGYAWRP